MPEPDIFDRVNPKSASPTRGSGDVFDHVHPQSAEDKQKLAKEALGIRQDMQESQEGFLGTLMGDISTTPGAIVQMATNPQGTVERVGQGMRQERAKSDTEFAQGDYLHSFAHGMAGMLPVIGPAAMQSEEELEQGKYGRAFAHLAEIGGPELIESAGGAAMRGLRGRKGPLNLGERVYEAGLKPRKSLTLPKRQEVIKRGVSLGVSDLEQPSKLQKELTANRANIDLITTHPNSPFAARTIPLKDIMRPFDDFIKEVSNASPEIGAALKRQRMALMKKQKGPAKRTHITVAEAQQLKKDFDKIVKGSAYNDKAELGAAKEGRKITRRSIKEQIELAIPEKAIRDINHRIEIDVALKGAIADAMKRHGSWAQDWAPFILGAEATMGAGALMGAAIGGGHGAVAGTAISATATAIGAMVRAATRDPGTMMRLGIALRRSGVALPMLGGAAKLAGKGLLRAPVLGQQLEKQGRLKQRQTIDMKALEAQRRGETPVDIGQAEAEREAQPAIEAPVEAPAEEAEDFGPVVREAADLYGVSQELAVAVAQTESGMKQEAVSPKGAIGIMQLMPETAKTMGVDPNDPRENIEGGVRLLDLLITRYGGDVSKALAAYNAGDGAVDRAGGDLRKMPTETREYVKKVLGAMRTAGQPEP